MGGVLPFDRKRAREDAHLVRHHWLDHRIRGAGHCRLHFADGAIMQNDETLLTSTVPRSLDTKSKILGLELSDVLILLLNLSVQNLVFGGTGARIPMVFGTSLILGDLLFFVKRGKPDQ